MSQITKLMQKLQVSKSECDGSMGALERKCYWKLRKLYPQISPVHVACFVYDNHLGCRYSMLNKNIFQVMGYSCVCKRKQPNYVAGPTKKLKKVYVK